MAEISTKSKQITLRKLGSNPSRDYQVWAFSARLAFEAEGLDGIIDGKSTKPAEAPANASADAKKAADKANSKWKREHGRVMDALIQSLEQDEIVKLWSVRTSAREIWLRLEQEYGVPLDIEYIRASRTLAMLQRDPKDTIDQHINKFERQLREVNFNRPPSLVEVETDSDKERQKSLNNLAFVGTLVGGKDAVRWKTFILAMGPRLQQISTQQLYAEVRAQELNNPLQESSNATSTATIGNESS